MNASLLCCKCKAKPFHQIATPLPEQRVEEVEITGVDFAGPLYCKAEDKAYIALFTCAVTQAIHSELVT